MSNPPLRTSSSRSDWFWIAVGLIWFGGFFVWFHWFEIPNNHIQRWLFWQSLPYDFLDLLDPPHEQGKPSWAWMNLLQRVPFLAIAILAWSASWGIGNSILRRSQYPFSSAERFFFSGCIGLSVVSLLVLVLGLCGLMNRWLLGLLLVVALIISIYEQRRTSASQPDRNSKSPEAPIERWHWLILACCIPFVIGQLLGAMSPQTDYDVIEYHLGGPKEWFLQGGITRLPHNVYTSFPFLSEMLVLSGMIVYGDWQWGALAGQAIIAGFAPLTAIGLFAAGRRWFSVSAGTMAALTYLSSPWTYRISIIAYAEGSLSCYLFAAFYAASLFAGSLKRETQPHNKSLDSLAALIGFLSGSAMACKYTGLISVVIPIGLWYVGLLIRRLPQLSAKSVAGLVASLSVGLALSIGPWLAKNAIETGNPVYPLAYRIFGGIDRDAELDAQWRRGHGAKTFNSWNERGHNLVLRIEDIMANNDWHGPLMFGLAPLSLLLLIRLKRQPISTESEDESTRIAIIQMLWLYVCWQFLTWWILTHHIDRFYVPMFSAVSLLAGVGSQLILFALPKPALNQQWTWKTGIAILTIASALYNADIMLYSGISGFNAGRMDLQAAERLAIAPHIQWMNTEFDSGQLPQNTKVLFVGEACLFHARFPYLYSTAFNHCLFKDICLEPGQNDETRSKDVILNELHQRGITHIAVNWAEILRLREPGSYGFPDFVHPDRFAELQQQGVLDRPVALPQNTTLSALSEGRKKQLEEWAPTLVRQVGDKDAYLSFELFPVAKDSSKL